MGYAVAQVCVRRGHSVVLVSGPVSLRPPAGVRVVNVETADDMFREVSGLVDWCDVLVMTAAVSDFRPRYYSAKKIKKSGASNVMVLARNRDILKSLKSLKGSRVFVGFAAETGDLIREAARKLKAKNLDLIVANDVTRTDSGFGVDTNRVVFLSPGGRIERLPLMTKVKVAGRILDWVEETFGI